MSISDIFPPIPYVAPWRHSLLERLKMLCQGEKKVAYLSLPSEDGPFRYRAYNMTQVLNETQKEFSAAYFAFSELPFIDHIADIADVLVICRLEYSKPINHIIQLFHARGKKVYFDIDDLIFNIDLLHLLLANCLENTTEEAFIAVSAHVSRMGLALKQCDAGITTNAFLAKQMHDFAKIPVSVIPNFLNKEQLEISDKIYAFKKNNPRKENAPIKLGYFSGSPTHQKDFSLVMNALDILLRENQSLIVNVVGCINVDSLTAKFGNRIQYIHLQDFINLQRFIGSVDFNLMPLQSSVFTNCKSELKYFEAAIVGTQSIASPTFTYANAIRHKDNGYLSRNYEWLNVIQEAITDLPHYNEMAARSYEDARQKYGWFNQLNSIRAALDL